MTGQAGVRDTERPTRIRALTAATCAAIPGPSPVIIACGLSHLPS